MLKDITTSFNTLVDSLTWMDEKTKRNTWKKASSIKSYIGYPEWLLNQGELEALYKNVSKHIKILFFISKLIMMLQ